MVARVYIGEGGSPFGNYQGFFIVKQAHTINYEEMVFHR
jgi:hypothetical protein